MKKYVVLEKQVGQTPLQVLEAYKKTHPEIADQKLAYAGRLDPMASGKLLVLIGDECKKQTEYHGFDKEYVFEILLHFSSDTGDVLGLAQHSNADTPSKNSIQAAAEQFQGDISLHYPVFSSKPVNGKPLFLWTLEGKLDEIEIPVQKSRVHRLDLQNVYVVDKNTLKDTIFEKINSIPKVTEESKALGADFRRKDIRARWNELFDHTDQQTFTIARFRCVASSGTYMRSLADEIGAALGTSGLAYSIHRTKIGSYKKIGPFGLWVKQFKDD